LFAEVVEDDVVTPGADEFALALRLTVLGAPEAEVASSVSPGPLTRQPMTAMVSLCCAATGQFLHLRREVMKASFSRGCTTGRR